MTVSKALTVSRNFKAAPEKVFSAFSDPALCAQWMGPNGSKTEVQSLDVREGGALSLGISWDNGMAIRLYGTFRRVDRPRLLEFTWAMEGDASETVVTVEFEPSGTGTELTLTHEGLTVEEMAQNEAGWGEFFDRLVPVLEAN